MEYDAEYNPLLLAILMQNQSTGNPIDFLILVLGISNWTAIRTSKTTAPYSNLLRLGDRILVCPIVSLLESPHSGE